MTDELEQLKYPIGRYAQPATYTDADIKEWLSILEALPGWMDLCIENLDNYQLLTPYRPGGWTVQQVVHHLADSHINMYVRIKLALTEDNPTVKPYDENLWAVLPDVAQEPVNISVTMLHVLHKRIVTVLSGLSHEQWQRTYFHPDLNRQVPLWEMTALYAWHSRHHMEHIKQLRNRMDWW